MVVYRDNHLEMKVHHGIRLLKIDEGKKVQKNDGKCVDRE